MAPTCKAAGSYGALAKQVVFHEVLPRLTELLGKFAAFFGKFHTIYHRLQTNKALILNKTGVVSFFRFIIFHHLPAGGWGWLGRPSSVMTVSTPPKKMFSANLVPKKVPSPRT